MNAPYRKFSDLSGWDKNQLSTYAPPKVAKPPKVSGWDESQISTCTPPKVAKPPKAPPKAPPTLGDLDTLGEVHADSSFLPHPTLGDLDALGGVHAHFSFLLHPLAASLAALEHRCPDHIQATDWQRAVEDGRRFLIQWGEQATALGWAEHDIFGLPPVPPDPHPSWQRLARVDQLGLVWLTHGRPVTSITAESATIATPKGGSVAFYRLQARQEPQKTIAGDTGGPAISSPVVHADEAAKPASYEVLGPAPLGRRCVVCNIVGLGPQLIRHDGRVDVMHPACAKKAFKPKEAP